MLTLVCAFHPGEDAVVPGGGPIPTWERLSLTLIQEGDCRQSLHIPKRSMGRAKCVGDAFAY